MQDRFQNCSVVTDGADQSAFGLPHFMTTTKDAKGHAIRARAIGVLEHWVVKHRLLHFTLTNEFQTRPITTSKRYIVL